VHELSICESIATAVTGHAGGRRVRSVRLRVGALRQIVPDTLVFCWQIAARGPLLEGSVLDVEVVPGEVVCAGCGTRDRLTRFALQCQACGGPVSVVAGEEMLIESIEVEDEVEVEDEDEPQPGASADPGDVGTPPRTTTTRK